MGMKEAGEPGISVEGAGESDISVAGADISVEESGESDGWLPDFDEWTPV